MNWWICVFYAFSLFWKEGFWCLCTEVCTCKTHHTHRDARLCTRYIYSRHSALCFYIPNTPSTPRFFMQWLSVGRVKSDPCISRKQGVYGGFKTIVGRVVYAFSRHFLSILWCKKSRESAYFKVSNFLKKMIDLQSFFFKVLFSVQHAL